MTNYLGVSHEMQVERESWYTCVGLQSAACLAGGMDYILEHLQTGRSAVCGPTLLSERCELEVLLGGKRPKNKSEESEEWAWPLHTMRMHLHRDIVRDTEFLGDEYTLVMEWSSQRQDVEDPGYTRSYKLLMPAADTLDPPNLSVCYQPSIVAGAIKGQPARTNTIESAYKEADVCLDTEFYSWTSGTEYEANNLFYELMMVADSLPNQVPYVWDINTLSSLETVPAPRICRLPQSLIKEVHDQL